MHFQTRPRCSSGIMYHVSYWFPLLVLCYLFPLSLSLSLSSSPHICMPMCDSSHRIPTQSLGNFQIIINTLTAPRRLNSIARLFFISYCNQRDDHEGKPTGFSRDYSACFKNMLKPDEDRSFFNRERDRLAGEIATVRAFVFFHTALTPPFPTTHHIILMMGSVRSSGIRRTLIEQQHPES